MRQYDESVLRSYADSLYARADRITAAWAITGVAFGCFLAYIPMISWYYSNNTRKPPGSNDFLMIISAVVFGAIFGAIGHSIGFKYRLLAEKTLCQVQIETNTREVADLLRYWLQIPRDS